MVAHYGYRTGIFLGLAIAGIGALMFYPATAESEEADSLTFGAALRHRHMRLGVLAIFLYVGAEVATGSFLINYISLPHIGNMTVATAAVYVSLYWGGAMLGRFAGAALLTKANPRTVREAAPSPRACCCWPACSATATWPCWPWWPSACSTP